MLFSVGYFQFGVDVACNVGLLGQLPASSFTGNGITISVDILDTGVSDDGKLTVWGHKDRLEPQVRIQRDVLIVHDRLPGLWLEIIGGIF